MLTDFDIFSASILIVDDQEVNIALLEQMLAEAGYTSISSSMRPQEVSELYRQHRYDLILLDLQMPIMDGFEVMQALKADTAYTYLPVLVLTAEPAHKLRALQAGARDFVSKPFDLLEVKTRIRNMLEVRLLNKKLDEYSHLLEQTVIERTAELRESEARYRRLTELASDLYWEQDEHGAFTKLSGPVHELLGVDAQGKSQSGVDAQAGGWNATNRTILRDKLTSRQPFLDLIISRVDTQGSVQTFQISGEPMFNLACRYVGYRGIGVEMCEKA